MGLYSSMIATVTVEYPWKIQIKSPGSKAQQNTTTREPHDSSAWFLHFKHLNTMQNTVWASNVLNMLNDIDMFEKFWS